MRFLSREAHGSSVDCFMVACSVLDSDSDSIRRNPNKLLSKKNLMPAPLGTVTLKGQLYYSTQPE